MLRFERDESPSYMQMNDYVSNKQSDGSYLVICCADYGQKLWLQRVYLAKLSIRTLIAVEKFSGMPLASENEIARNVAAWFSYGTSRRPKPLAFAKLKEYSDKEFAKFRKAAQKFAKTRQLLRPMKQDAIDTYLRRYNEE
jgi:hypothetical protein